MDVLHPHQATRQRHLDVRLLPVQLRFAWPSELDLMARLAGLALEARFGGWQGEAFTAASATHVSVYGKRDA